MQPNKSPEPTAVGAVSSAVAVHVAGRRRPALFVRQHYVTYNLEIQKLFMDASNAFAEAKRHANNHDVTCLAEGLKTMSEGLRRLAHKIHNLEVKIKNLDGSSGD